MSAKPELPDWSELIAEVTGDGRYMATRVASSTDYGDLTTPVVTHARSRFPTHF
jgi:hypothetical protein